MKKRYGTLKQCEKSAPSAPQIQKVPTKKVPRISEIVPKKNGGRETRNQLHLALLEFNKFMARRAIMFATYTGAQEKYVNLCPWLFPSVWRSNIARFARTQYSWAVGHFLP